MGERFWEAFNKSLIIQGIIALVLLVVIAYLYLRGQTVPEELISLFSLVLGYYFGSKSLQETSRIARNKPGEGPPNV